MAAPTQSSILSTLTKPRFPGCLGNAPVSPAININNLHNSPAILSTIYLPNFPTGSI